MHELDAVELSSEGVARRAAMRTGLQRTVVRRRRVRSTIRYAAAAVVVATAALFGWSDPESLPRQPGRSVAVRPSVERLEHADLELVRDDLRAVARWTIEPKPIGPDVFITNDDDLLAELAEAGLDTGLMRVGSRVVLTAEIGE